MPEKETISLCMIVKDEEHHLRRCLDSIKGHVDEINIIDTGSTDSTPSIAREYAHNFLQIPWPGSFSLARNASLELATKDWVMIMDADEYLLPEEDFSLIHEVIQHKPNGIALRIFNHLPDSQALASDWVWQLRLWPNHRGIHYSGRVHNQISPSIQEVFGEDPLLTQVEVTIQHDGYNLGQERMIKKYERRISLLKEEIEGGGTPRWINYYKYQLGNALFMLRDFDEALYTFNDTEIPRLTEENAFSLRIMCVHCNLLIRQVQEADNHSTEMINLWPHEPMAFMMKGLTSMELERYSQSLDFFLSAMQRLEKPIRPFKYNLDKHYIAAAAGEAALHCNKLGEAKGLFQLHLEKYPDNDYIRDLEQRIQRKTPSHLPDEQISE